MDKQKIGIITFPIAANGIYPLSNLIDIINPLSSNLHLITGNEGFDFFELDERVKVYGINHKSGLSIITRICRYAYTNFKISYRLFKLRNDVDIWIFFIGGDTLFAPMLTARLLKKICLLSLASSATLILKSSNDKFFNVAKVLTSINYSLSSKIILHSEKLLSEWDMEHYYKKVSIAHEYFIDFDQFNIKKGYKDRDNLVGYIGSISEAKGVLNYVQAIPKVIEKKCDLMFLIGGKGDLLNNILDQLAENNLDKSVRCTGWIPHDKLPDYLNNLKLLVIPSYTESGPIIALEAMSCGTPILATRVGQVLNMVEDGINGFIMENNSPECIAKNIIRVVESPNLEQVIINAKDLVRQNFAYKNAVESYEQILDSI